MNFKCVWAKNIIVYFMSKIWKRSVKQKQVQTVGPAAHHFFQLVQYILIDMRIEHCPEPADICNKNLRKCQQQVTSYLVDLFRLLSHAQRVWLEYIKSAVMSIAAHQRGQKSCPTPQDHAANCTHDDDNNLAPRSTACGRAFDISIQKTSDVNMSECFLMGFLAIKSWLVFNYSSCSKKCSL